MKRNKGGRGADSLQTPLLDPKESAMSGPNSRTKYRESNDGTELEVYVHDDQVNAYSLPIYNNGARPSFLLTLNDTRTIFLIQQLGQGRATNLHRFTTLPDQRERFLRMDLLEMARATTDPDRGQREWQRWSRNVKGRPVRSTLLARSKC
jgi:hypothetical protein